MLNLSSLKENIINKLNMSEESVDTFLEQVKKYFYYIKNENINKKSLESLEIFGKATLFEQIYSEQKSIF
jgi:Na+/phosphate symporter